MDLCLKLKKPTACPGTDRKLTHWDCYTGESTRELEASASEPMLSAAVNPGGTILASGAADRIVKLWRYDEGTCFAAGDRHTGELRRCVFSPDGRTLVTADSHGALMFWDVPMLSEDKVSDSCPAA